MTEPTAKISPLRTLIDEANKQKPTKTGKKRLLKALQESNLRMNEQIQIFLALDYGFVDTETNQFHFYEHLL